MATLIEMARKIRPLIVKAAQMLDDADAIQAPELYDEWKPGVEYTVDYKIRRNGKVWKVLQAHTSQEGWEPENAASLFAVIDEVHAGTLEDPIPYDGNMELFSGKYYSQDDVIYLCIRDSGTPLHHALIDLVGLYVEAVPNT